MKKISFLLPVLLMAFSCSPKNGISSPPVEENKGGFSLSSPDFRDNSVMPKEFTCDGANISPSLSWSDPPEGTKSFILTVMDPDAPTGNFRHWTVVNIPGNLTSIAKNSLFPPPARALRNDFGRYDWGGPCPPSGTHRYVFSLYAVDSESYDADVLLLEEFLGKHSLGSAALTGLYKRGF